MKYKICLRSHVSEGKIIFNGKETKLSLNDYFYESAPNSIEPELIVSVKGMPPGIKKGIEIIFFELNGRNLLQIGHLSLKDFCFFQMHNNPYVDNRKIVEKNIVFNGDLFFLLNSDKVFWFPFHYSEEPGGFVYNNNYTSCVNDDGCYFGEKHRHKDIWSNKPFADISFGDARKIALGSSVTFGTGVSKSMIWSTLLGCKNLSVAGGGVDSIYYNLNTLLSKNSNVETAIILFPSLDRRLATFVRDGMHFRIPIGINDLELANYYWADKSYMSSLQQKVQREMVLDTQYNHSIEYLAKIAKLPIKIYVSSTFKETYEILPKYFDRILPFFERIDEGNDNPPHPGPLSHSKWASAVEKIL